MFINNTINMSGASALASARRRRAGTQEQPPGANRQVRIVEDTQNQSPGLNQDQSRNMTPLQILKIHDDKLNNLEEEIDVKIDSIINEKINNIMEEKIKTINSKNVDYDDEKILNNINAKMETLLSNKLNSINDTIKSILLNIEKLSSYTSLNEKNINKMEELISEVNALKMLVIKNQTLSLETNNDIIKMKDNIKNIEENFDDHINKIASISDKQHENIFEGNEENLLKAFFNRDLNLESFSRININSDELEENNDNIDLDIESVENIKEEVNSEINNLSEQQNLSNSDTYENGNINEPIVEIIN